MIRKSVETRDWLNTIEPRNIRSVMKRVVEEVTVIDKQVGTLYEDGVKKDQGSGQYSTEIYIYRTILPGKGGLCSNVHFPSEYNSPYLLETPLSK